MDLPTSATPRTKSTDPLSIHPDSIRVSTNAAAGEFARHLADSGRLNEPARREDRAAERRERPAAAEYNRRDDDVRDREATRETDASGNQPVESSVNAPESTGTSELLAAIDNTTPAPEDLDSDQPTPATEDEAKAETAESSIDPTIESPAFDIEAVALEVPAATAVAAPGVDIDNALQVAHANSDKSGTLTPTVPSVGAAQQTPASGTAGSNDTPQAALGAKAPVDAPQPQAAAPQQVATDAAPAGSALDAGTATAPAIVAAAKPLKGLGQEAAEVLADKKSDAKQAVASANSVPQGATSPQAPRGVGTPQQAAPLNVAQAEAQPTPRGGELPTSTQPAGGAATVRIGTLPGQSQPTQLPAMAIALQIARNLQKGVNRFDIRLDPPEMGRIDVRMEVRRDGHVMAHLTVEKPETLELLQRDARALQQALNNAGLDADENSLNFSLRDQNGDQEGRDIAGDDRNGDGLDDAEAATTSVYNVNLSATGGIDIRV
ncbi:MAG: flagellar hook-length control protein FliK [Parvibaculum sp.]|uniref:flagellar hook-length control protein FliK n=1 Tax=Parvibaculum sp. TaxID=2024848 RepID=UPI00271EEAA8|nr:flagellar hook-length control protein FliK [Parvibaculum sp.]MDO8839305.1 flagellar hook-length control protein FliK [Parvibaculum sp.]